MVAGELCCLVEGNGWAAQSCRSVAACEKAQADARAELEKARCKSPAECPNRAACVVGGLGGPIGCTGAACCGVTECSNGCRADADCPSCRPRCRKGPGEPNGVCAATKGP